MNAQIATPIQITSFTGHGMHTLLIDREQGIAYDCRCQDRHYRGHTCKHMTTFDEAVERAATFLALKRWVQGLHETARANREMFFDSRFQ